jgi:hypothetical protein
MKAFWNWLFWRLFRTEAATLERYRNHTREIEDWFSVCSPEVSQTAQWVRQYSEPKLYPGEEASGLSISSLRVKLFGHKLLRRTKAYPDNGVIRIRVSTQEIKLELLQALKHIHDSRDIDTDIPMVNNLVHLYQAPHFIEVYEP